MSKRKVWLCSASDSRMPQAEVLGASVRKHTDYAFGRLNPGGDEAEQREHRGLIELLVSRQRSAAALKLLTEGADEVIVSGSDYLVCGPLVDLNREADCLFCPHTYELMPEPPQQQNVNLTRSGVINSDFQVWRNTRKVREFLRTMIAEQNGPTERIRDALDFEQLWLPYALSCANGALITHPGYGMSYYNMHEREIIMRTAETYLLRTSSGEQPLRTFHFSGMEFGPQSAPLTKYEVPFRRALSGAEVEFFLAYKNEVAKASQSA